MRYKCLYGSLEEGGLAGLAGCEDNDIASLFNTFDEISDLLGARNNVVLLWINGTLCTKTSHVFLLFAEGAGN